MDKENREWLTIVSIAFAVIAILLLMLSGYDLGGFEIHKGIKIN